LIDYLWDILLKHTAGWKACGCCEALTQKQGKRMVFDGGNMGGKMSGSSSGV
jgi:hypothetical protein